MDGTPELEAFAEESAATETTLGTVEDWQRPALGEWTTAELAAHLLRAVTRITEYLDRGTDAAEAACDRVGYWRADLAAEAPAIAQRAREQAAGVPPGELPARFAAGWRASVERAGNLDPATLLPTIEGPMRLDEYTATRVLEVVVHHVDLRRALDLPPATTPAAGRITMETLEALLGAKRPRNLGRARFIQVATGRLPSDDPRFPVLV